MAFTLRTLVPIRLAAIGANVAFILYGALGGLLPPLILHSLLLPVNAFRLHRMFGLVRAVRAAATGDLDLAWLKPFMHTRGTVGGEYIFTRGERADAIYFVVSGCFQLLEIDKTIGPGEIVGEIGLVAEDQSRTLSLVSLSAGQLLTISYEEVRRLYFQDPQFSFYLLKLISRRLLSDLHRLEPKS